MASPKSRLPLPNFIRRFIEMESASGLMMIMAGALAMIAVNSPFAVQYQHFITLPITIGVENHAATEPLKMWVKDVLMVVFFLIVGLELKREMKEGFMQNRAQILLPLLAALGGMLAPAAVFMALNYNTPAHWPGWAIASATDIAFALCILMLVGKAVPPAAKVFLLAIAIFDDLGAIIVVALFYSTALNWGALALAAAGVAVLAALNYRRVDKLMPYMLTGIYLWFCFDASGIHTTVAGVIVGLMIPMRSSTQPSHSPIERAIHFLHPWVSFLILPLFAFTSAGVAMKGMTTTDLLSPLTMGIALALFLGKQIGIFGSVFALVKLCKISLPEGTSWHHIYGVAVVCGVGFTMSLFIGLLAFSEEMQPFVKLGVLMGSCASAVWGAIVFRLIRYSQ